VNKAVGAPRLADFARRGDFESAHLVRKLLRGIARLDRKIAEAPGKKSAISLEFRSNWNGPEGRRIPQKSSGNDSQRDRK
jgi:hypothetical protein